MSKLFIFDLGETLVEYDRVSLNWSDHYENGIRFALNMFNIIPEDNQLEICKSILTFYNTRVNPRKFEIGEGEALGKVAKLFRVDEESFAKHFFTYFQRKSSIREGAEILFQKIKSNGDFIAILTDVPYGMPKSMVVDDLKELNDLADTVLTSSETGFRKPHPIGLEILIEQFNMEKVDCCYIGNEKKDVECAHNAGIKSILIDESEQLEWGQLESFCRLTDIVQII